MNTSACTALCRINQGRTGTSQNQSTAQAKTNSFFPPHNTRKQIEDASALKLSGNKNLCVEQKASSPDEALAVPWSSDQRQNSKPMREKSPLDLRPAHWSESRNEEHFRSELKMN
jgi:hypothetical protein